MAAVNLDDISSLRRFLSSSDPPIQIVVDSGVVNDLIRIVSSDDENLIYEAIWYVDYNVRMFLCKKRKGYE